MTEEDALQYFDSLAVDDRLRLMQRMLADMENRIARARSELNGPRVADSGLDNEVLDQQLDLPGLEMPVAAKAATPDPLSDPVLSHLGDSSRDSALANNEWDQFELPSQDGGPSHAVHRLRLIDAAAQYERLLKRYGYINTPPGLGELTRRARAKQSKLGAGKQGSAWSDWVARDQETLDRPKPQQWQDWVVIGDDEGDI